MQKVLKVNIMKYDNGHIIVLGSLDFTKFRSKMENVPITQRSDISDRIDFFQTLEISKLINLENVNLYRNKVGNEMTKLQKIYINIKKTISIPNSKFDQFPIIEVTITRIGEHAMLMDHTL